CNVKGNLLLGKFTMTGYKNECEIQGYEIHAGCTTGAALARPLMQLNGRTDGAISDDGQVIGTYLHGLFESRPACEALLRWAGLSQPTLIDYQARREADINRLADTLEQHLDMNQLDAMLGLSTASPFSRACNS
ncbi:hypothetical protein JYT26_02555, partial [Beggiatoa alba]|nr:hypothetical protein [Beggiatoa alba]